MPAHPPLGRRHRIGGYNGTWNLRALGLGYGGDKPVALLGKGFNKTGVIGVILQSAPDLTNGIIKALVKFDKRRLAPNSVAELLASDDLACAVHKDAQYPKRLRMDLHRPAI